MLDREVPAELDVHVVLDNRSTNKTPAIQKWLLAHPRFVLHFTPTSSSWLNLVERWLAVLTSKKLRRGTHRSVCALNADIRAWIETCNDAPKPYIWTKTADQILELNEPAALTHDPLERAIALKPRERRDLLLLAGGHSYQQIAELTGSSYTAVNRRINEGRAHLRQS
jgi:DNA-directed RNA polymerase specialized sigma24 family protein